MEADTSIGRIESKTKRETDPLLSGFLNSSSKFPNRLALEANGETLTYEQLFDRAAALAATLQYFDRGDSDLVAVFAYRSPAAFEGVLGALMSGHGYVPLNQTFPIERTRTMLQRAGCTSLVVDETSEKQLDDLLQGISVPLTVVLPHRDNVLDLILKWPQHCFVGNAEMRPANEWRIPKVGIEAVAYLLFTSGSTGMPKGVLVTRANVRAFVDAAMNRYTVCETDRLSQFFDLTFDLSAFDMFMAWETGACICCPSAMEVISPGMFINKAGLTICFSVPSTATFMHRLGALKPNLYPNLRWSLFCGEALPLETAEKWLAAAPNSIVENLYGPTELTIACSVYRFDPSRTPRECEQGVVPIGEALPGTKLLVVDEGLREVAPGATGELIGTGSQRALGYLNDHEKTQAAFVRVPEHSEIFYRTGDLVRRPIAGEPLTFLGRIDNQIKMRGFRIEPGEIEAALREETGMPFAVAVGWPRTPSGADGIVAFVETDQVDVKPLERKMRTRLPQYMLPREYRFMTELPRNPNGKVDRKALLAMLDKEK
jgi:amino acid adenylation domain-containing protein